MLVTFTTEAFADITMFGDVAHSLLKMMGHSGTVPGGIRAEDIPSAIGNLQTALEQSRGIEQGSPKLNGLDDDEEPGISIFTRAQPLIALLMASAKAGKNVMWS